MSRKRQPRTMIVLPDKAALEDLAKALKLEAKQAAALDEAICTAEWEVRTYLETAFARDERQHLVRSLKNISRHLGKLISVMEEVGADIDLLLPQGSQDAIEAAMSPTVREKLLGPALGVSDALAGHRWKSLALSHPGTLLKSFLQTVQMPVTAWIELDQLNKGGRPADLARWHLVRCLAETCPAILGREAPISMTGPFVELCAAVFTRCGLDDTGVEKLVPQVISSLRKRNNDIASVEAS
jgi:hypothetical protein